MSRKEILKKENLLHIYNRGNRKQNICEELEDYIFLHNLIKTSFKKNHFDLLCFCLMPNHSHLLTKRRGSNSVGKVMQRIGVGYTKYFNMKYTLSGHLFQGTYRYKLVTEHFQLRVLSQYIKGNLHSVGWPTKYPFYFTNQELIDYYFLIFSENLKNPSNPIEY
jgi:REP element-mobilizing transposase RayT